MIPTRLERFQAKYNVDADGCWIWHGAKIKSRSTADGPRFYGSFNNGERQVMAHRWSYENFVGPIGADLVIDHLCRVTLCVNPEHLEAVTQKANLQRGNTFQARNAAKVSCPQGHPYDEANTRIKRTRTGERRVCKACDAEAAKVRNRAAPKKGRPTGERSGSARLNWEIVREIRRRYSEGGCTIASLAREYNVAGPTISFIVKNKSWIEEGGAT